LKSKVRDKNPEVVKEGISNILANENIFIPKSSAKTAFPITKPDNTQKSWLSFGDKGFCGI
ncbi:MAG: hypothetical protein HC830_00815, partial [Bacteroidetes bacterium]|nr:hypothetical protein [Bacteroidota bacterium]